MKELKINPRFLAFSPKKKPDEIKTLKESLEKDGYQGAPILTWKDYIVDGHNRYKYCEELGIEIPDDKIIPLGIPETEDEIAVLLWIAKHHLSSKNLEDGEKLALMDSVKEELQKYNEEQKLKGAQLGGNIKNGNVPSVQNNGKHKSHTSPTHTREQLSKETGVSTGNIAKYDVVMKSDDEELKQKVKTGEVKIGTAYREVKKRENKESKIITETTITSPPTALSKESSKPLVENGVILLEEKTDDDKMMNDIARRMKSGQADLSKINNESELNNIKEIISTNVNSAIAYVRSNLNFDEFNSSDLQRLREIIYEATKKMETLMKDMEELVNEK